MSNIIYGSVISPFVRKVLIVLNIKNISYESKELIPFINAHRQELLQMNPLGKVPVYQEDNFIISDSSAICAYLERKYPHNSIYPQNTEGYAKCLWYEEYADDQVMPIILTIFFNKLLATKFNREPDLKAVEIALEQKLPIILDYLDSEIGNKKYLVGDKLTLADISISAPFINLNYCGYKIEDTKWKNLAHYINNIYKEKYIKEALLQVKERFSKKADN